MSDLSLWLLILGMGILTFAIRAALIVGRSQATTSHTAQPAFCSIRGADGDLRAGTAVSVARQHLQPVDWQWAVDRRTAGNRGRLAY